LTLKYWQQPKKIENSGNQPVPVQLGSIIVTAQAAINLFLCSLAASLSWGSAALGRSDRLVASTTAVLVMTAMATAN